jgi:hypothetical protein
MAVSMGPANPARSPWLYRSLAGLQTGVLGGAAMYAWLAVSAALTLRSPWRVANLLGSLVAGRPSVPRGFGWVTASGLGLHLALAGLAGILFGLWAGGIRARLRVTLLGIVLSLALYYGAQYWFWRKLGIYIFYYSPPRPALLAHLIYGLALGWLPGRVERIRQAFERRPEIAETASAHDTVV